MRRERNHLDNLEAMELLHNVLTGYRRQSHQALSAHIGQEECLQVTGASGTEYQIEVQFFRDGRGVLVVGSIDDGGWRAFVPLTESFVVHSDGSIT
jgi:hypothetical protein